MSSSNDLHLFLSSSCFFFFVFPRTPLIAFPISEVLFVVAEEERQCTTTRHRPRGSVGVWVLLLLLLFLLLLLPSSLSSSSSSSSGFSLVAVRGGERASE